MDTTHLLKCKSSDGSEIAFKFEMIDLSLNESLETEFITEKNAAFICAKILSMLYPNSSIEFSRLLERCQVLGYRNMCLQRELDKLKQNDEIPF